MEIQKIKNYLVKSQLKLCIQIYYQSSYVNYLNFKSNQKWPNPLSTSIKNLLNNNEKRVKRMHSPDTTKIFHFLILLSLSKCHSSKQTRGMKKKQKKIHFSNDKKTEADFPLCWFKRKIENWERNEVKKMLNFFVQSTTQTKEYCSSLFLCVMKCQFK